MTIGMVAVGDLAAQGLMHGLKAVEQIARGAIGGFVSFVAIGDDGALIRKTIQRGGAHALFVSDVYEEVTRTRIAGLISSGPDRPEPLAQFVAAETGVGIVTGHRMPQALAADGVALNQLVLQRMRDGQHPQTAIDAVIEENRCCDAGLLACNTQGVIGAANAPFVQKLRDSGGIVLRENSGKAVVGTLHNAIEPSRLIAQLASEVAMDWMLPGPDPVRWVTLNTGTRLAPGNQAALEVDEAGVVQAVRHPFGEHLGYQSALGLGDRVAVLTQEGQAGWLAYEPFMTVRAGRVERIDGQQQLAIPVIATLPQTRFSSQIVVSERAALYAGAGQGSSF